ncbi:uncharacterized protein AMSG_05944 [Thecamonas trahens ATCC 50062]|uniref:Uncharacterized protein n=1 Tax=Thecamonas trahens ATCC 50062 TaxID=461836 RepID=A0A0L0DED1_THETB|nr:hypothetical protein AMSG_05944 [Thecamonas trahens ATCC 50062]KNC49683.1 hypothetical protein AMSG_05944 [Thecamonas trahens ATCC 50062]|eukprot:XP_013757479.1 hypothetical protein AMSG_05944 [Thecamonas trahens ATCC 50062]
MELAGVSLEEVRERVADIRQHVSRTRTFVRKCTLYTQQFFAANAGIDPLTVGAVLESAVNDLESEWNAFLGAHEVELVRAHGLVAQLLPLRLVRMVDMPSKSAARLLLAYRGALDRAEDLKPALQSALDAGEDALRAVRAQLVGFRGELNVAGAHAALDSLMAERRYRRDCVACAALQAQGKALRRSTAAHVESPVKRRLRAHAETLNSILPQWYDARGAINAAAVPEHNHAVDIPATHESYHESRGNEPSEYAEYAGYAEYATNRGNERDGSGHEMGQAQWRETLAEDVAQRRRASPAATPVPSPQAPQPVAAPRHPEAEPEAASSGSPLRGPSLSDTIAALSALRERNRKLQPVNDATAAPEPRPRAPSTPGPSEARPGPALGTAPLSLDEAVARSLQRQEAVAAAKAHEAAREAELNQLREMRSFRERHPSLFGQPASPSRPGLYTVDGLYRAVRYVPDEHFDAYDNVYGRLPDDSWRDSYIRVSIPVASTLVPASIRARGKPSREAAVANLYPDIALSRQVVPESVAGYSGPVRATAAGVRDSLSLEELALLEMRSATDDEVRSNFSRRLLSREIRMRHQLQRLHATRHVKIAGLRPHEDPYPN